MCDRTLIDAIKHKVRHWVSDHTGLSPGCELGEAWAIALEEIAAELRRGCESAKRCKKAAVDAEIQAQKQEQGD